MTSQKSIPLKENPFSQSSYASSLLAENIHTDRCLGRPVQAADLHPSRIEMCINGQRLPIAPRPPVLSASSLLGEGVILERHITPRPAEYAEHELLANALFLYEGDPTRVECDMQGQHHNAQVRPGHVWIIPHSMPHKAYFHGPHGGVVLSIENQRLERQVAPILHGGRIELDAKFNLRDGQLEHLLRGLLAVAQDASSSDALVADLMVNALCIRLAKRYAVSKLKQAPRRGVMPAARLRKVLEFIDANLDQNIRLSALADAADMSLYYFATLFRQSTGVSPHQYILGQRIERAKQLLLNTKLSVLEVSLHLGFEHQNNFARAFRRVTGVSPMRFRVDCL